MADDIFQRIAQMQAMQGGANAPGRLMTMLPDVQIQSLSLQPLGFGKNIPSLLQGRGKPGGLGDKFLQAIMAVPDELRQKAAEAGVIHSGTGTVHVDHGLGGTSAISANIELG